MFSTVVKKNEWRLLKLCKPCENSILENVFNLMNLFVQNMKSVEKLASVVLSSCHVLEVLRCTYKAFVLCYLLEFSKPLCLTITKQSRNTTTSQESRKQKHHKAKQEHHSFTGTWQTKKHCSTGSELHCFVEPLGIPQSRTIYIYKARTIPCTTTVPVIFVT